MSRSVDSTSEPLESPFVDSRAEGLGDRCLTMFVLLWLIVLWVGAAVLLESGEAGPPRPAPAAIDPNVAPWWELTILPGIGESTARRIADYRASIAEVGSTDDRGRVFSCAADLAEVHGIGPKTVRRVAAQVRFNDNR